MKHLNKIFLLLFAILLTTAAQAQDENNPWALFIGANAIDFYPTGSNIVTLDGRVSSESFGEDLFFETDNWNYITFFSSVGVTRYIGSGFSFELGASYNKIDRVGLIDVEEEDWINLDGTIQYNFKQLLNSSWFDPYLGLGAGYFWLDDDGGGTFNTNLGVNFWIKEGFALTLDTNYKSAFDDGDNDFFHHRFGLKFAFGGKDTDGDGVYDKKDACPDEPGLAEFDGCPDTDGDGIINSEDACPNEAGSAEFGGCPDSDGDGIADKDDACPSEAGLAEFNGCPDADNDGIADKDDNCPTEAGPAENNGCPWPDTDGDGVFDKDDQCPDTPGTAANFGCPELSDAVKASLSDYAKKIQFETGKTEITGEAATILNNVADIMKEYPNAKFVIEGYTDSTGREQTNLKLSEGRAASVEKYLEDRGVEESRLTSKGYGEANPIADNKTRSGRAANRRVEIKLVK